MSSTARGFFTCRTARTDEPYRPSLNYSPERLSDIRLKNRLCDVGPRRCAICKGCLYGQEWLRRHPEEAGGRK